MLADVCGAEDATAPPTDEDYAEGSKKNQMIAEFDMDVWQVCLPARAHRAPAS